MSGRYIPPPTNTYDDDPLLAPLPHCCYSVGEVEPEILFTCLTCRRLRFYSNKWARKGNAAALPTTEASPKPPFRAVDTQFHPL